ncbi:MAG: M48 family metalloprotease [bacterium]
MKRIFAIFGAIAAIALAAQAHAFDIGQAVSSGIGGVQQIAAASKDITPSEEHYIGRAVAAMIIDKYPLMGNAALDEYVNKVGLVVAYHSDRPVTFGGYHFAVLRSDEVNAFAAPGGFIFITRGLLKSIQNEDQLANVLGHEVAHVAERHGINAIKKSRWTKFGFYAAGEVGKQYSSSEVGQLAQEFQGVVSDVAKQVIQSGYSKKDENEADKLGMEYAARAGYSPKAMADFIQAEIAKGDTTKSGPFSSHPSPDKRLSEVEGDLKNISSGDVQQARTARFSASIASLK